MKHSELPWHIKHGRFIENDNDSLSSIAITSCDATNPDGNSAANAQFIVKACNNHYKARKIIKSAYLTLLSIGMYERRLTADGQELLASMRDIIADMEDEEPQKIQESFELAAMDGMAFDVLMQAIKEAS